jgi:signal transduction histidine kinase/ligand-binding sensor domain-containing protein
MLKIFKKLLFTIILIQCGSVYANKPQIQFKHITSKDGLSHSWVTHIYKDSYGYMWFATESNGINKYDGHNFNVHKHNPKDKKSLTDNLVTFIYEDTKRNLWVGTQYGLNLYNRELDKFTPYVNLYDRYVSGMCERDDGKFYVTTLYDLIILDTENKSVDFTITESDNLPYTFSEDAMLKYAKNKLLIGTTEGLFSVESTTNNITPILKDISVRSLYKDSKGNIWIGTEKKGLFCMTYSKNDSTKPIFKNYKHDPKKENSLSNAVILKLQEDYKGFLWIATESDGINLLDLNNIKAKNPIFYHYRSMPHNESGLSSNSVQDIYIDNQNTIWISTYNRGIDYYNKVLHKFDWIKKNPDDSNSLSNNNVHVFFEEDEILWIGTSEGLNIYNRKNNKWQHFKHKENNSKSIGARGIYAIFRDSRKNMWIGTWRGGLNLFNENKKTFTRYLHDKNKESSISSNNIFDITEDRDGTLWTATMGGGINNFDYKTNTFEKYIKSNNSTNTINDWVTEITESHNGEIWIATGYGVYLINKEKKGGLHFRHMEDDPKSISNNSIVTIFEDSKHNLWFGTESGLNIFNRDSCNFSFYSEEDGLPNNAIKGILEDDYGNLWLSTNKGISKFIGAVYKPKVPEFKNFSVEDGLQGNEFNKGACLRGKDGKLYFGGNNGFNAFYPDSIKENPYKPEIIFTNFFLFNKPVEIGEKDSPLSKHISLTKEISLSYKQSVISIQYAALNFLAPGKCEYAVMLEGFDEKWNYVGSKREATYTNLNPGKYTFRVKGSNNDGIWSEKEASLRIIIAPPFWKTLLFRILITILTITIILRFHILRTKNIVEHRRELEKKVAERTEDLRKSNKELEDFAYIVSHDLKAPLRGINELAEWISEDYSDKIDEEGKENLEMMKERATRMNQMIQSILEYSRIGRTEAERERIDLNELLKEVIDLLSPPDNVKIIVENKLPEYTADRTRLIQLFENLLSNAIKHAGKTEVTIKVGCEEKTKEWQFSISDNGPGIEKKYWDKIFKIFQTLETNPKDKSTGIGLTIVKKIVDLYKGRLWVKSKIGKGTTFYFTLPKTLKTRGSKT